MEITHTEYKRCDLVAVSGRVDSATAPKLAEKLSEITESGRFRIILDLSHLDFISSAGLRVLIGTQKNCKRYNRGEVALANIQPNIMSSLELAGFTPFFKIFDDTVAAVGNF
jgi:anti-sigma B factor antagonist